MNKTVLTIAAALLCAAGANAAVNFTSSITRTADQDTLTFEKTPLTNDDGEIQYQTISTTHDQYAWLIGKSQTKTLRGQFAITATDLGGQFPKGSKLTRLSIDGYNNGGKCTTFNPTGLWIDAYDSVPEPDYLHGYSSWTTAAINKVSDSPSYSFSSSSTKDANVAVIDIPLISGQPYTYTGTDLLLTMLMEYTDNNAMNYCYKKAAAVREIATVLRDKDFAFSAKGIYKSEKAQSWSESGITLDSNTVPAFKLSYYTNDIRVKVRSADDHTMAAYLTLWDATTGEMLYSNVKATDYTFSNLDYTHSYTIKAYNDYSDAYYLENIDFGDEADAVNNDIEIVIKHRTLTGVDDAISNAAEVDSVKYVSMQGIESAEPFSGVQVVVTTYTDGTRTAMKKFIK